MVNFWTPEDDDVMRRRYWQEGAKAMSLALERSVQSVYSRACHLGLTYGLEGADDEKAQHYRSSKREHEREHNRLMYQFDPEYAKDANDRNSARRQRWIDRGLCCGCGKSIPLDNSKVCLLCWVKRTIHSTKQKGLAGIAPLLILKLEHQNYICPLTGDRLIPGTNASLDHIVPVSKGGTHSIDNLQWVTKDANLAKHALSTNEFIDMCRRVAQYHSKVFR